MRLKYLTAACLLAVTIGSANAVTFGVTGTNYDGQNLNGTIIGDAALTNVTAVDLNVSGVADPLTIVQSYVSPLLNASNISVTFPIYLSFAGGPTLTDVNNLIAAAYANAVATDVALI